MAEKKFVIFFNDDFEGYIALSEVNYHREIMPPAAMGKAMGRAGGGKWSINPDGELRLYDLSGDFGKYDKDMAREAFNNKHVYCFNEPINQKFNISKLIMD